MKNTETIETISQLVSKDTLSGEKSIDEYKNLWLIAYPRAYLKGKKYWEFRLNELETFDNCNGKENERQGKIEALKILISK